MNGGMVRHAVEPEELVEPDAQKNLQRTFLRAAGRLARDEPVERGLPAHNAECDLLSQSAIDRRQRRPAGHVVEEVFQPASSIRVLSQDTNGNFSWFFGAHVL